MATTSYYYDYHYPVEVLKLLLELTGRQANASTADREWFSQLRPGSDPTTEVLTVTFRLPLSVSEISTDLLRIPCRTEFWYQDRSNNWRQVLDRNRNPLKVSVGKSDTKSWFRFSAHCYPIVAKKVQIRITRVNDPIMAGVPYPVGVRNTLIRRNVYDRTATSGVFEDDVDVMGNVVSKTIRDWDPGRAVDDNYTTFWKSEPQPDPSAVVSLYLDVRTSGGSPQVVDKIFLDPVYTGQHLNVYYSTDESVGTRVLSPITVYPQDTVLASGTATAGTGGTLTDASRSWATDAYAGKTLVLTSGSGAGQSVAIDANTATTLSVVGTLSPAPAASTGYQIVRHGEQNVFWEAGKGLTDLSAGTGQSWYQWPMKLGLLVSQDAWLGVEWTPEFDSETANLAANPILFGTDPGGTLFGPTLYYDPADGGRFCLQFSNGTDTVVKQAPVIRPFGSGETLRIVAGWRYKPTPGCYVAVKTRTGETVALLEQTNVTGLPTHLSLDGVTGLSDVRGTVSNLIVKLEPWSSSSAVFLANPTAYCDPDPVIPDENGNYPSTTLDNAVYAAPWLSRQHGLGGPDQSHYTEKEWMPVRRDYTATKGFLRLPQPVIAKYLKLEFTNLTEEPYPIWESGLQVRYKVFPVSVLQQSSAGPRLYTGTGGFLGLGTFISMNGVRSVNWLNPASVMSAVGSVLGTQVPPVIINTGSPYLSETLPYQGAALVEKSRRIEAANRYVYTRDALQPYVLAADRYTTLIKAEGLQAIAPLVSVPWSDIQAANPDAITKVNSTGTIAVRGTDWWIYPGQTLRIPASVMRKLTDTSTVTERKLTLESRVRFTTTSVHRYETRTVTRDVAIAYFAGVREVQPFTTRYVAGQDLDVFDFKIYDSRWGFDNITSCLDEQGLAFGPITTASSGPGTAFTVIDTQSDFAKVDVDFRDSGPVRSDSMWAKPDSNALGDEQLAPYVSAVPTMIAHVKSKATSGNTEILVDTTQDWTPGQWVGKTVAVTAGAGAGSSFIIAANDATTLTLSGGSQVALNSSSRYEIRTISGGTWNDAVSTWGDATAVWGSPYSLVSVAVSGERRYQGNRVLHVSRPADVAVSAEGSGEAGVAVTQHTNFIPMALARFAATYFKPLANDNTLILRLRRSADGHIVYQQEWTPPVGVWNTHITPFIEIPPTLVNGGFDQPGLSGWTGGGLASWSRDATVGRTGTGSAKLVTGSSAVVTTSYDDGTAEASIATDQDGTATAVVTADNEDGTATTAAETNPYTDGTVATTGDEPTGYGTVPVEGTDNADGTIELFNPDAIRSTLSTEKMAVILDNTVRCSAWVRWEGLTTTVTSPVIYIRAVYYSVEGDVIGYRTLEGATISSPSPSLENNEWLPVGGALYVPSGLGIYQIAFQIVVENVEAGGQVWVDDVLVDVPGADRQTYELSLTMKGNDADSVYVSDLYTEIAPIRYFLRLGGIGAYTYEVTDLRHAVSGTAQSPGPDEMPVTSRATVTAPSPVNEVGITVMILTPRAAAFGCSVRPHYLK